jgi:CubicO group peptidase (beta-lactamase class C family)
MFRRRVLMTAWCLAAPLAAQESRPLADKLRPLVEEGTLAGAVVLVANAEKTLAIEAVGFEDIAAKKPMAANTMVWIASMSKPIAAACAMMLADEGKLDLDAPVEKYLPEFRGQKFRDPKTKELAAPKRPMTVRQLLSHTSGLPYATAAEQPTLDGLTLAEAVKNYAAAPLIYEPGAGYRYSNCGINTAGRIVEVLSGMPFEKFLDDRLLRPLGMKDTTFWPNAEQLSRLAKSYRPAKDKQSLQAFRIEQLYYPLDDRTKRYPMPAAGLFSTAEDCARFGRLLLNRGTMDGKRLLSEQSVRAMATNQNAAGLTPYGLGCSVDARANGPFGHGGAYATDLKIIPERGLVLVFQVQHLGWPKDGKNRALPAFHAAALAAYGK